MSDRLHSIRKLCNRGLDRLVQADFVFMGRSLAAFQVFGCVGAAVAVIVAMLLAFRLGLSPVVIGVLFAAAALTFLALVMATKIITGEERIVYYHHEIAVTGVAALVLRLLRLPVLPYLDLTIVGIGLFLAFGRVGCLMAGCCHGRPHRWGVRYTEEHAAAGFTPYYAGVRLFPVQALESLWVLAMVLVALVRTRNGYVPGDLLAWYAVTYGWGRFCFEFLRGDPDRPFLSGFSQPQWISLLLMCALMWAELAGAVPFHFWHAVATLCLALTMLGIALGRHFRKTPVYRLRQPRHVREVVDAMRLESTPAIGETPAGQWTVLPKRRPASTQVQVGRTSLGVQISSSKILRGSGCIEHYALSHQDGCMTEETARVLAAVILHLKGASGSSEFVQGRQHVFHLLIHPAGEKEAVCR